MALPEVIKELLENGVHFGHLGKHWNPKMKKFIFGKKKNVYIIDLEKTAQKIEEAKDFVRKIGERGEKILFVATKKQLRDTIKELATSCNMPYVCERWVGGLLTNFVTVNSRIRKYGKMLEDKTNGVFDKMSRKGVVRINRDLKRMQRNYSGVSSLEELPTCIFVVDPKKETAVVREANKLAIPIVGIIDTDADPDVIDYPIPANDDAIRSVKCIISHIAAAINEGVAKGQEIIKERVRKENEKNQAVTDEPDVSKYEVLVEELEEKKEDIDIKGPAKKRIQKETR